MMTITGEYVGQDDGAPSLEALALGLSRTPRFGGQTVFPWTVADHLLVAARMADKMFPGWLESQLRLHVLLHDAHEMLTGDIPTTFKTPDMKVLQETKLDPRIYASLGVKLPENGMRNVIKVIDEEALLAEAAVVCPSATYLRIVAERGHYASLLCSDIVRDYLHEDFDGQEQWFAEVEDAIVRLRGGQE